MGDSSGEGSAGEGEGDAEEEVPAHSASWLPFSQPALRRRRCADRVSVLSVRVQEDEEQPRLAKAIGK